MEFVRVALERAVDRVAQTGIERGGAGGAGKVAVAAGAGEDGELLLLGGAVAQHQDAAALDVDQRRELGQHALGQSLHRLEVEQRRGALDDHLEAAAGLDHALELLIAAQRRGERGEQLVGGQLGLRLVVVDVVVDDDAALRRLPGLPGAQDDADGLVLELGADVVDELQAGVVGLHHHVEQDHRDVRDASRISSRPSSAEWAEMISMPWPLRL